MTTHAYCNANRHTYFDAHGHGYTHPYAHSNSAPNLNCNAYFNGYTLRTPLRHVLRPQRLLQQAVFGKPSYTYTLPENRGRDWQTLRDYRPKATDPDGDDSGNTRGACPVLDTGNRTARYSLPLRTRRATCRRYSGPMC